MRHSVDVLIVGQGLAGTTLGWQLHLRKRRVGFIDSAHPCSASRVAAGLLTPITGTRLAITPHYRERRQEAVSLFEAVESVTGSRVYNHIPAVRVFTAGDRDRLASKSEAAEFVCDPCALLAEAEFDQRHGEFEMPTAGRLEVAAFLNASRAYFQSVGPVWQSEFDADLDVSLEPDRVRVPRFGVSAKWLVFCQGYAACSNPWFPNVVFNAAKGEILTVRVPGLTETRTVNGGVWLTPIANELYRVGATYDRARLDCEPSTAGREELIDRLRQFLRLPFEVVEQRAAVRPIIRVRKPILGTHPVHRQLAYFNGLGSKGALLAPHYAGVLADHLIYGTPLDPEVDVAGLFGANR